MVKTVINIKDLSPEERIKWLKLMGAERSEKLKKLNEEEEKMKKKLKELEEQKQKGKKELEETDQMISISLDDMAFEETVKKQEQEKKESEEKQKLQKEKEESAKTEEEEQRTRAGARGRVGIEAQTAAGTAGRPMAGTVIQPRQSGELEEAVASASAFRVQSERNLSEAYLANRQQQDAAYNQNARPADIYRQTEPSVYNRVMDLVRRQEGGRLTNEEAESLESYREWFNTAKTHDPRDVYENVAKIKRALGLSDREIENEAYKVSSK